MSVDEILAEIQTFSPDELALVQAKVDLLLAKQDSETTSEMLAAIDEGLRSLREEPTMTLEELRAEMRTWTLDSK